MKSKERWLATLQCQPVDRLSFWPKIDAAYAPYQQAPFSNMSSTDIQRWIRSDQHVWGPPCVKTVRSVTNVESTTTGRTQTTLFRTPAGTLVGIERFDPLSHSWHPTEYPVKSVRDIESMSLLYADERSEFDADQYEEAQALIREVGEDGLVVTALGISPLMNWLQYIAGIENGHLLLIDHPDKVLALLETMHQAMCRRLEIIVDRSPYPVVYSVENTSTTLISPALFRQYCHRHLVEYGRITRQAGKLHLLHMCGKLKLLLPDIATLQADGIEAFTSPPVGNTTLFDGRTDCPDKCLIGGTNATLWLESAGTIIETIKHDLDALPHQRGIVVTSAGVMPPACKPETIKQVADWIKNYAV